MSIRVKLLSVSVGLMIVAMLAMGVFVANKQRNLYQQEMESKAKVLLEGIAASCVSALASGELERLDRLVEELHIRLGESTDLKSVVILNHRQEVVGHTNKEMYGRRVDDPFIREAYLHSAVTIRYEEQAGHRTMRIARPLITRIEDLPGIRWGTVIASLDMTRSDSVGAGFLPDSLMTIVAFALLAAMVIIALLQKLLFSPITRMSEAAYRLKEGDFTARSGIKGSGELAQLSATIDGMAAGLQRNTTKLQELVDQRTESLKQSNEELRRTMQQLQKANERLEEMATTDPLTGLRNRRYLKEMLDWHFPLAQRSRRDLAFIMIDIDHFKNYNDTHGHPAGDKTLSEFANILHDRIRRTDVACRYGGEEFAIMLPDTGPLDAKRVGEVIRSIIEQHEFPMESTQPGGTLTASVGVGSASSDMEDPSQLVEKADKALYRAKAEGRNKTVLLS